MVNKEEKTNEPTMERREPVSYTHLDVYKRQLKFRGIDNINDIEKYRGCSLWVAREDAVPLEEDEYYIGDLIGMQVFTEDGNAFGTLKDVMEKGANDVYILETEAHGEVLAVSYTHLEVYKRQGLRGPERGGAGP